MNNNTNPNLPANAVRTTDVRPDMVLDVNGTQRVVTRVRWYGFNGIIEWDGGLRRVNAAGTMRLA